jgi:AraC family transcriptional regulator
MQSPEYNKIKLGHYHYPPHFRYSLHNDRIPRISIVLSGQVQETAAGREEWASAASLVFKPADLAHANRFGPQGARILSLMFPDERWLEEMAIPCRNQWRWLHGLPAARDILQFVRQIEKVQSEEELQDRLIEFLALLPTSDGKRPTTAPPPWLPPLMERLREECEAPPAVGSLARELGLHPVYLARVFRKWEHCSIKEYIHRRRLEKALDALATGRRSLADIAYEHGYADQSHFSRYFKAALGMSPGCFRDWVGEIQVSSSNLLQNNFLS